MVGYLLQPIIQIENSDGKPLEGGKVYVYKLGITPPVLADTYFDFQGHLNTNPIILDSLGHCTIIAEDDTAYDVIIKNKNDELQFSIHNATVMGGSGEIVIENEPVSVIEGNGLKVEKETLLDGTIQYKVSNNAINPTDKGEANFITGKDNDADGQYNNVGGNKNTLIDCVNDIVHGIENNVSNSQNSIVIGYKNEVSTDNIYYGGTQVFGQTNTVNGKVYNTLVAGYSNTVTSKNNSWTYDNIVAGQRNELKAGFTNAIFGTANKQTDGWANLVYGSNNILDLADQSDDFTEVWCTLVGGSDNTVKDTGHGVVIGNNNEVTGVRNSHNGITVLGQYNKISDITSPAGSVIGYYNTVKLGDYTGSAFVYQNYIYGGGNNIEGSQNIVAGFSNNAHGCLNFLFGHNLKSNDYADNKYKFAIGINNEDKPTSFLEIANEKNLMEFRKDDSIYYRYNDEMVQLKPSSDNILLVSTIVGQPEYKTFDEMFELIEEGKYLVLIAGIPGAAFFYPVKGVSNNSIDFDGYDRIISYKNDNTTEIVDKKMVCEVDNVSQQVSKSFSEIKKCLDNNGDVVLKFSIDGYNIYSLLRPCGVTQDFILFSSTYIPNESTTPHTLTLKLNSDESVELVEV